MRPHDIPPRPVFRPLFRGESVSVHDWRCPGCDTPAREAEHAAVHEVVVVRRGAFVREVDGASSVAHAGVVMLVAPGEAQRFRHPVPGGDDCSVFRPSPDAFREVLGAVDLASADAARPRIARAQRHLEGREFLLHALALRAARRAADPVEAEEASLWFVHAALADGIARPAARRTPGRTASGRARATAIEYTARVLDVVSRRSHERLTLARIGSAVHCSPFHLSRLVASVTGLPIHRLLVRHRLRLALERVLDTRETLSAIAFATGFSSHSHFTDAFRRAFGAAPAAVRRLPRAELRALLARGSAAQRRGGAASRAREQTSIRRT